MFPMVNNMMNINKCSRIPVALLVFCGSILWYCLSWEIKAAANAQLNLFIWSEYIDPAVVRQFEANYACKIVIDLYEDEASMLAKIQSGGASLYDIVVPPNYLVPILVRQDMLAPLRHVNLPNLVNLEEEFQKAPYDPGNQYTVAYFWGAIGIYARKIPGQLLEPTWATIFDPAKQAGSFCLLDVSRDTIGAALQYRGFKINSIDAKQLQDVRNIVIAAKKRSLGFDNSVGGRNKVLNKTAALAMVYSSDAARGMKNDAGTFFILPKEGTQIYVDNLAILAKAPHRDLAEKFINFLLDPKIAAQQANYVQAATPNKAAKAYLKAEDLNNPSIYPPIEIRSKMEYLQDLGTRSRIYDEIWTQIKVR